MERVEALVKRSHLLPEEWQSRSVFFKDTVFIAPAGNACIPCLRYDADDGVWRVSVMDISWCRCIPGALFLESVPIFDERAPAVA
jgi:hypothetical protein